MRSGKPVDMASTTPTPERRPPERRPPGRCGNEVEDRQEREGPDRDHVAHPVRITQEQAQQLPPARDPDEPLAP